MGRAGRWGMINRNLVTSRLHRVILLLPSWLMLFTRSPQAPCLHEPSHLLGTVTHGPTPPYLSSSTHTQGGTPCLHLPVKCNDRLSDYYSLTLDRLPPCGSPWSRWYTRSAVVHSAPVESLQEFDTRIRCLNITSCQSQFPLHLAPPASSSFRRRQDSSFFFTDSSGHRLFAQSKT